MALFRTHAIRGVTLCVLRAELAYFTFSASGARRAAFGAELVAAAFDGAAEAVVVSRVAL
ncbi:MAG TPA: hypothetical protein VER11_21245 [Polyangiaceae bacterium]|nr:hypothetical protein [Polyangiaceae bacterium]